jgi:hypothetical protein
MLCGSHVQLTLLLQEAVLRALLLLLLLLLGVGCWVARGRLVGFVTEGRSDTRITWLLRAHVEG